MCSIGGALYFPEEHVRVNHFMDKVIQQFREGADRGRDCWGLATILDNGNDSFVQGMRGSAKDADLGVGTANFPLRQLMYHCRAIPVTEFTDSQHHESQPVYAGEWIVSHNGLIANDLELISKYQLDIDPDYPDYFDSKILPLIFTQLGSIEKIKEFLQSEIKGSFAIAAVNKHDPGRLILACNYKPIYTWYGPDGSLYYSSQAHHIDAETNAGVPTKMTPYMFRVYTKHSKRIMMSEYHLEPPTNREALIVFSGGMDSTVVAAWARNQEYNPHLLHFHYGCKASDMEEKAVKDVAAALGCTYEFFEIDLFKRLGQSSLIDPDKPIVSEEEGAAEYATEWVPARNLVMLSIATAIAEAKGFDTIMFGGNLEESGSHPDNEIELVHGFNYLLPNAVQAGRRIRLVAPLINLMKPEIVRLGMQLDAPLEHSWTCYTQGPEPCGNCGACYNRIRGFELAGFNDPALPVKEVVEVPIYSGPKETYADRSHRFLQSIYPIIEEMRRELRSSTCSHYKDKLTDSLFNELKELALTGNDVNTPAAAV